jgi:hypothetical protein
MPASPIWLIQTVTEENMAKWVFLAAAIYLIGYGLTARSLISESDMPATKEERRRGSTEHG